MPEILLIDADSVIPNIPLMKLSAYWKDRGYKIKLIKLNLPYYPNRNKKLYQINTSGYDKVYCSVIFTGNKKYIQGNNIVYGGTGFDIRIKLPEEIENYECDYSIYPDNNISYGFISRGCIRTCKFCFVPRKEGYIHQVSTINKIAKHNKVKFLDNNILALSNHKDILRELVDRQIRCCFNQGLDIRLIDEENSFLLSKMNYLGEYVFAFDNVRYYYLIMEKLKLLNWKKDWQLKFFVYICPDMPVRDITFRIKKILEWKCLPYVMRDIKCWNSALHFFYTDLAAWCNQVNLIKNMNFKEFMNRRHTNKHRIKACLKLWKK